MRKIFACILFVSQICFAQRQAEISIIPQPVSIKELAGNFFINRKTAIIASNKDDVPAANFFNDYLKKIYGFKLQIKNEQKGANAIRLKWKMIDNGHTDSYFLNVKKDGVEVIGDTHDAVFYGTQTLIQLLPFEKGEIRNQKLKIPFVSIEDYPRFPYRGMHLDCGRHFFPVSFVKKYIDYIALHKMNYFHWHLTEDQGWRIEIKKYPNLTKVGAWRNGTIIGRYPGTGNDNIRYGGYYTQKEIKDVVKYAAERHIAIIPEIEMPGHSSAAIASYPWLSCFPNEPTVIPTHPSLISMLEHKMPTTPADTLGRRTKLVQETWGVFEDVYCAGNDSTFIFLENVLDEVTALFPSKYIHIGGDECPKTHWKKCPKCQARMKELGLKNEEELQSYFIQRIEKYLNSKGRTIIGWDEILEGGLAPNAWVMSWRGEKGGIDAATQNHNVVMTPGEYVYFDHSQTKNEDSLAFGGYTPLEKVYSYEPVPKKLDAAKENFVQGSQGNVWTEYMAYPSKVEYMIFPRMSALSEVLWTQKDKRDWNDFEKRLQTQFKRYELWNANYSKAYFDLKATISPTLNNEGLQLKLESKVPKADIQMFMIKDNNDTFALGYYEVPVVIKDNGEFWASFRKDKNISITYNQKFSFNKATGKKVSIATAPSQNYPGQGAFSLVNGIWSNKGLSFPDWLGWVGDDIEATIDLGKKESFSQVKMHTLDQNGSWVYLPKYVVVFVSTDGINFTSAGRSSEFIKDTLTMGWITVSFPQQTSRYIKVVAKNYGMIPDGQPGAGNKAWLFADELQVN